MGVRLGYLGCITAQYVGLYLLPWLPILLMFTRRVPMPLGWHRSVPGGGPLKKTPGPVDELPLVSWVGQNQYGRHPPPRHRVAWAWPVEPDLGTTFELKYFLPVVLQTGIN